MRRVKGGVEWKGKGDFQVAFEEIMANMIKHLLTYSNYKSGVLLHYTTHCDTLQCTPVLFLSDTRLSITQSLIRTNSRD